MTIGTGMGDHALPGGRHSPCAGPSSLSTWLDLKSPPRRLRFTPGYVYEGLSRELVKVRVIVGLGWRSSINMGIFILRDEALGVLKGQKGESQPNSSIPFPLFLDPRDLSLTPSHVLPATRD